MVSRYRHIALYTLTTPATFVRWVTSGPWEVAEINCVDESTGVVYYTSTQASPLERNLYAVPLTASTSPLRLSSRGWNSASFSPSKRCATPPPVRSSARFHTLGHVRSCLAAPPF